MDVLSIQSHVAYGHVGNDAAVFPMQRLGVEVWPIHTVQFSNHTGYGDWTGRVVDGPAIEELLDGIAVGADQSVSLDYGSAVSIDGAEGGR